MLRFHPAFGLVTSRQDFHDIGENHFITIEELIASTIENLTGRLMEGIGNEIVGRHGKVGARITGMLDFVFPEQASERLFARG